MTIRQFCEFKKQFINLDVKIKDYDKTHTVLVNCPCGREQFYFQWRPAVSIDEPKLLVVKEK